MALTGKKTTNTQVIEGISWQDRYVITGTLADPLKNVVRLGGQDTTGSFYERAIVWTENLSGATFTKANYSSLLPNGALVLDVTNKNILIVSGGSVISASLV